MSNPITPTFKRIDIDHAVKVLQTPGLVPVAGSFGSGTFAGGGECCLLAALVGEKDPERPFEVVTSTIAAGLLDLDLDYALGLIAGWDGWDGCTSPEEPAGFTSSHWGKYDGELARAEAHQANVKVTESDDDDDEDWDDGDLYDDEYDDEYYEYDDEDDDEDDDD